MKFHLKRVIRIIVALFACCAGIIALFAFWPEPPIPSSPPARSKPFAWKQKELFAMLEKWFTDARLEPQEIIEEKFAGEEREALKLLAKLEAHGNIPPSETLRSLEEAQFRAAAFAAASPALLPRFRTVSLNIRRSILRIASKWSISPELTHETLYRLVAGGRIALEEAVIQQGLPKLVPAFEMVEDVPSPGPWTMVENVRFCTGDILLARGNIPTSALIARSCSFPGGFSHVAMVYIAQGGSPPLILESTVKVGSVVTPIQVFLDKHRHHLVLLRLRPDTPEVLKSPEIQCNAAKALYALFERKKVPYDFAMRPDDRSALFCSEAIYTAYRDAGIVLWPSRSQMDTPGIIRLLSPLGIREFANLTPQDLELDPRLVEVAEWRDLEALSKDRLENALLGAVIGAAERGASLRAPPNLLAASRLSRCFSDFQSIFGFQPAMPVGMSASCAARLQSFQEHIYPILMGSISRKADSFRLSHGYEPPAWVLSKFANESLQENKKSLEPFFR